MPSVSLLLCYVLPEAGSFHGLQETRGGKHKWDKEGIRKYKANS